MTDNEYKEKIIKAGYKAVEHLIEVAEKKIVELDGDDEQLAADRLKNAAASKKLAIFDAFEILSRIQTEKENISISDEPKISKQGFAERHSKSSMQRNK
jgi:hypothetical protein